VDQVSQPRKFALQDLLVEKQQGSQRLILGRRADVSFGETRKKGANLGLGQGFGMALAVEDDEAPNPSDVGLLGARAIVTGSQAFPDLVKKTRSLPWPGVDVRPKIISLVKKEGKFTALPLLNHSNLQPSVLYVLRP